MYILQKLVFPNLGIDADKSLYIRPSYGCIDSRVERKIVFSKSGSSCGFDTYFNSFTVNVWKNKTIIDDVRLRLEGEGVFIVKIGLHKLHAETRILSESKIELKKGVHAAVDIPSLSSFVEGMIFFELISLSDKATITGGCYYTLTPPVREVNLGIVVTHFNRKNYVLPAIERVSSELLEDEYYSDNIKLIVVDNSSNITADEAKKAIVIPNQNLGGSGGFTRGLLYLQDQGNFSHCLFMDDDASCEIESIRRAYALLQYANIDMFAVAGAQLRELAPFQIHEKGARFDNGKCMALHHTKDMRDVFALLLAEFEDISPNYGAWWFFAFAINDVKKYPFPFFVRGDDMLFSLQNKFNICTLNGIGVWGEDFFVKESPLTRYLGFRAVNVCDALMKTNFNKKDLIKSFSTWYLTSLFSYNYSSAKAIALSLNDFLHGVDTFVNDMDASGVRAKIAELPAIEKMQSINRRDYVLSGRDMHESKIRKVFRFLTINGLLIPSFLMKDEIIFQSKHFRANFRQIFRFKKVFYEHEATRTGYIAQHDKSELISGIINYCKGIVSILKKFDDAKKNYLSNEAELTTKEFWEGVYNKGK